MKKYYIFIYCAIYVFLYFGFVFHSSSHPEILGKYTQKYFIFLIVFLLLFIPFILLIAYTTKTSIIKIKKRVIYFTPIWKIGLLIILPIIMVFTVSEIYLQIKYSHYNASLGSLSQENDAWIDEFDPFLQLKFVKGKGVSHINSYGFRADEMTKKKPEGTYRIFLLGDSVILGGADYKNTSTYHLQQWLQKHLPDRKFEIINAGVRGYTSEHSLILYLFKIKDFQPDMIIMQQGISDLMYSCSPQGLAYGPFQPDYSHYYYLDAPMVFSHFHPKPFLEINSLTYIALTELFTKNLYSDINNHFKTQNVTSVNTINADNYDKTNSNYDYTMTDFPSIVSYKRNLQSFIAATKADGVTLVLGNQQSLYGDNVNKKIKSYFTMNDRRECTPDGKYLTYDSLNKGLREINDVTKEVASEDNVPFIDLDSAVPKTFDYFWDDVHGTQKGYKTVGETIGKFLITNHLL